MIGLLQRVSSAEIDIHGCCQGKIGRGLLVFIGVERGDSIREAKRLLTRLLGYRVFADEHGRMNRSLVDIGGALMLVPQFTLPADTRGGTRPSFSSSAPADLGETLFKCLVTEAQRCHNPVVTGSFGADMQIALINDGPVTFWLQVPPPAPKARAKTGTKATNP